MVTQRLLHAIPVAIQPAARLKFMRASLLLGVSLQKAEGPLARNIKEQSKTFPVQVQPDFVATHLIVVDQNAYLKGLDSRLAAEGTTYEKDSFARVDLNGIARQILIAITLRSQCAWEVGGHHTFDHSDPGHTSTSYSHYEPQRVSGLRWNSAPDGGFLDLRSNALRVTCALLDCYYRTGTWWVDRLSVALGYLWSALTTSHIELSFVALCMALEAIASTSHSEITHILAERCAVLVHSKGAERLLLYQEIKKLYSLRSKIVHGRSAPRKGPMSWETLAITAKRSIVPRSSVMRMLAVTIQVINAILNRPKLLEILHVRRSEEKASDALNEYFQSLLLRG